MKIKGEFVYAVTAAEGIILSLFMSNEEMIFVYDLCLCPMNNEDKMILSAAVTA